MTESMGACYTIFKLDLLLDIHAHCTVKVLGDLFAIHLSEILCHFFFERLI